jgi:hypothetical protein
MAPGDAPTLDFTLLCLNFERFFDPVEKSVFDYTETGNFYSRKITAIVYTLRTPG